MNPMERFHQLPCARDIQDHLMDYFKVPKEDPKTKMFFAQTAEFVESYLAQLTTPHRTPTGQYVPEIHLTKAVMAGRATRYAATGYKCTRCKEVGIRIEHEYCPFCGCHIVWKEAVRNRALKVIKYDREIRRSK